MLHVVVWQWWEICIQYKINSLSSSFGILLFSLHRDQNEEPVSVILKHFRQTVVSLESEFFSSISLVRSKHCTLDNVIKEQLTLCNYWQS